MKNPWNINRQTCICHFSKWLKVSLHLVDPSPYCYTLGGLSSVDFCDNELGNESEHVVDAVLRLAQRGVGESDRSNWLNFIRKFSPKCWMIFLKSWTIVWYSPWKITWFWAPENQWQEVEYVPIEMVPFLGADMLFSCVGISWVDPIVT